MSERKVLQKWYPADFDPRAIARRRGPKQTGPRIQTVRLMSPFSMKCLTCGEYIYKGRKFNSRKETNTDEKYLNIQIFFFHIKCTRCSAEITFRTDPKNNDYAMVKGAMRSMEPWRNRIAEEESLEQKLDRLEKEEAEAEGEEDKNAMADLEAKNADARLEMATADALDEIRHRNARIHRSEKDGTDFADAVVRTEDEERQREEMEDEEAAKRAFAAVRGEQVTQTVPQRGGEDTPQDDAHNGERGLPVGEEVPAKSRPVTFHTSAGDMGPPPPTFKRVVKKKKDHSALLGIKKKPSLV